ncbi:MAG: DAK2 domain-containing protein [Actinobacteria bacterium]|nr:DAK2 domain-containing protein [Actinomycetota bacterium]
MGASAEGTGSPTGASPVAGGDGVALARVVHAYRDLLRAHQEELNRANVYPVPDGDTGTNMALTLESVLDEIDPPDGSAGLGPVCRAIAHGSLMGARGNSGVILSQILRGLCATFADAGRIGPGEVASGLQAAADAAYAAVLHPVEGTILTVVRAGAEAAAAAADRAGTCTPVVEAVREATYAAVARTPEQLPVLAEAGVVDAGGRGLALLFDAWLHVLGGRALPTPSVTAAAAPLPTRAPAPARGQGPRYEVMFLLACDAPDAADRVAALRAAWDALGDSIVVVGGDGVWNCHVHTDDIGAAVEAGIAAGRPSHIHVTDLWEQVEALEADRVATATAPPTSAAVVAVATGEGIDALLTGLGVSVIVPGGQSMNPSTQEILTAIDRCAGGSVVVLPNNKNIVPVAEQAAALAGRPARVVPTRSVVEALAALLDFDPEADADANAEAMAAAAARVRTGEVTRAVRDSRAECGPIAAGDWIGITRAGIGTCTDSAVGAVRGVLDELLAPGAELVTVLVGDGVSSAEIDAVRDHLAAAHPDVEVEVHVGGQPLYPFLVGVE